MSRPTNGAALLADALRRSGITHVFGLPGTQNAEIFSLFPEHGVKPVLATHEASATFMANGYARASGETGVAAAINGPGFMFALSGLAEARLDSVPVLLITGTPPTHPTRRFLHQWIDQQAVARSLVKSVIDVHEPGEVASAVSYALRQTKEGEPGPVVLQLSPLALGPRATRGQQPEGAEGARPSLGADRAAQLGQIPAGDEWHDPLRHLAASARRPVLYAGMGCIPCAAQLQRCVEAWNAPTLTTVSGRGVIAEDHPLSMRFDPDRGGVTEANQLLAEADLVLAIGCKLSHNGTAGFTIDFPSDRLVHVNVDVEAVGANYPAHLGIRSDAGAVLDVLEGAIEGASAWSAPELEGWRRRIGETRSPAVPEPDFHTFAPPTAETFFGALRKALPPESIVVTDSGLHQVMTRRYWEVRSPGGLMTPTDFQSMGFGVPAAIGATLADTGRPVVAVVGDGGFLMTAMDLLAAAREGTPLPVFVFNDGHLNLIRLQQFRDVGKPSAVDLSTPDLQGLAFALDIAYETAGEDVVSATTRALERAGPTLIEVPLGDSASIRRSARIGRVKYGVKAALGPSLIARVKALLGR